MNKFIYILPIVICLTLVYMDFSKSLNNANSRLISRPVPKFELLAFSENKHSNDVVKSQELPDEPMIINIFASWCPTCIIEHPQLMDLADKHGVTIYGIAYQDTMDGLSKMLTQRGNPYEKIAVAPQIYNFNPWDLRGTPESYILDAKGIIRYHHQGPISQEHVETIILPLLEELEP